MKVVVFGATGTIGKAVVEALKGKHDVISVSRSAGGHRADITDKASLERALAAIGVGSSRVDLQACKLEYSIVSPK